MRTILLTLEYRGTNYVGWQIQPNGLSVQQVVEEALAELCGEPVRIHASGRTDAGVHARCMLAHFQTSSRLPLPAFRDGLNRFLPQDIAVREAREMPAGFHARYDAGGKWYRYTLYRGPVRSPIYAETAWQLRGELDLPAMRRAAGLLVGRHDFRAFRSASCAAKTTQREIFSIDFSADGDLLHIDFRGSGFLKNMIRMLVGTLIQVGQGRRPESDILQLLAGEPELRSGPTAPAHGLCLMEVWLREVE
jgi:tRNA pseudouridine38-40 synthase